jgi:4-alpha-glucanotransferase
MKPPPSTDPCGSTQPHTGFSAPFRPGYRASGVLLHVTSLPSPYGIGDLGPSAFAWVRQLAAAGQSWWQVLPLGPTGYGNSPYQALSSFAANPLVLSPDQLLADGLITRADCAGATFPADHIDFERVGLFKETLLARAWENFGRGAGAPLRDDFESFLEATADIQLDPALFMALRRKFGHAPFQEWPIALAGRERQALARAHRELADEVARFRFGQFLLLRHWRMLKDCANQLGVLLLGDLPIFVAPDSSDVWANPELFQLDEASRPSAVAGVPPDYFSSQGQLWGNPVYDWDVLRRTRYRWWIDRLQSRLEYVDAVRIDHFRGFEAAWHVPADASTAQTGQWVPGPGAPFFERVRQALGGLPLLAEDLGLITPAVTALRDQFELPGMRVLQFAFSGDPDNPHLPHQCGPNAVVYTGTHDNNTTRGWYDEASPSERQNFWNYLRRSAGQPQEVAWEMIRLAWSSDAALAITPFQDLLGLGADARMNVPGRADGQWRWRCVDATLVDPAWERLRELTEASRRSRPLVPKPGPSNEPTYSLGRVPDGLRFSQNKPAKRTKSRKP